MANSQIMFTKKILLLISSIFLSILFFILIAQFPSQIKAQCIADGSCIGPGDSCCSGNYNFDTSCPVTETRCGPGTCTCGYSDPFACNTVVENNCNSGFSPVCQGCSAVPNCACEPSPPDCGDENEFCCPGNTCNGPLECINLGYGPGDPGGGYRCLRPCDSAADCDVYEVCSGISGGCTADPSNPPPPEVKVAVFCDSSGEPTTDNTGELYTAIGCIPFNTGNNFIRFILRWGIGIAGGIAFILIIVAAFQIITSQGDPKRLQAGRELLTSAIAGLVLLIFSVLILRLIGVNLLGIPGFGT